MKRLLSLALASTCVIACIPAAQALAQDVPAVMERGREARVRNNFAAAEAAYDEAARLAPNNAEAWHMLGLVRGFRADYNNALAALATAEKLAPNDVDISLSVARINAFAGRYAAARQRVDAILTRQPNFQAAWVLKGRIASYQSQLAAAREAYDTAAAIAAPDVDLLLAYGDLARLQGDETQARGYYAKAAALDPASVEVKERLAAKTTGEIQNPWTLSLAGGKSWLSRTPASDWTTFEATLDRDLGESLHVFGGASYARRFSLDDVMVRLGGRGSWNRLAASLELGFTPTDDVLPEFQVLGSASFRALEGTGTFGPTVAVLDGQLRHYATGAVKSLSPGFDQYIADGRLALSARLANTWDATDRHFLGWNAAALWQATDRLGLRVAYGNAPEADRGLVADTTTLSSAVIVAITGRLTWRLDLARESREGGYRRIEAVGGIALKF